MAVVWERSGEAFYADLDTADGTRYRLIIERLPGGGWDWSVWRPGDLLGTARRGTSKTIQGAMWVAEQASIR